MAKQYIQSVNTQSLLYLGNSGSQKTIDQLEQIFDYLFPLVKDTVMALKPIRIHGRAAFAPDFLFRIVLLSHLYNLSERETVDLLADRISFRKFVGINYEEQIPDRRVIRTFLHSLYKKNIGLEFITKVISDLCSKGIVISKGKIVDSTIVEAHGKKTPQEHRRDQDANFTKKHSTTYFGYKGHVIIEKKNKIITAVEVTTASVSDYDPVDSLLKQDKTPTKALYGDKGYQDTINEGLRESRGIKSKIMHKKPKLKEMQTKDHERNTLISKIRSRVEHIFGRTKNEFQLTKTRFYTLEKNAGFLTFIFGLYNVKVALKLI